MLLTKLKFVFYRKYTFKGDLKKTIRHFQFHGWPDFGTPKTPLVLDKFLQTVHAKSLPGLIVVHCR